MLSYLQTKLLKARTHYLSPSSKLEKPAKHYIYTTTAKPRPTLLYSTLLPPALPCPAPPRPAPACPAQSPLPCPAHPTLTLTLTLNLNLTLTLTLTLPCSVIIEQYN